MSMKMFRAVVSRWRRLALSVVCVVGVMVTAGTSTAAASGTASAARGGARPTIVFVHGAFADSSGWNAEVAVLLRLGYPVVAAPNPLRGLSSDADYVRSILRTIAGPIVLVGHSYGGAVITNAARGVSGVKSLVYVGAFVPDRGESIATRHWSGRFRPRPTRTVWTTTSPSGRRSSAGCSRLTCPRAPRI
jgi:pimeloyl-ACP methyl ester carboxylesterase